MAVNYDLNNTGQEVQERLDQVMPNKSDIEQEVLDRQSGDNALQEQIDAINTEIGESGQGGETINGRLDELESAVGSGGSVDERIAAAEAEIIGGASEDYNTLGKVEGELVDTYRKGETYSKEQLDSLITTPDVEYVTVTAVSTTTDVATLLPNPGAADTVYRVGNWDGTQYDPTVYSLYAWNGSAYVLLAVRTSIGEVYDISVNHPDGQGNPAVYTDLANALGANGINVPADIRHGGMSVKFIKAIPAKYSVVVTETATQPTGTALSSASSVTSGTYEAAALTGFSTLPSATGSANAVVYYYGNSGAFNVWTITMASAQGSEYKQCRLMSTAFSTDPADWQGVDAEPTAGSRNLVESGGVANTILQNFLPKEIREFTQISSAGFRPSGTTHEIITLASSSYNIRYYQAKVSGKYTVIVQNVSSQPDSTLIKYLCNVAKFNNTPEIGSVPILYKRNENIIVGGLATIDINVEAGEYIAYGYNLNPGIVTKLFSNAEGVSIVSNSVEQNDFSPVSSDAVKRKIDAEINNFAATGYLYVGIANPNTLPQTSANRKVFYIATQAGTYTNFNNAEIQDGISILSWNGNSWNVSVIFIGTLTGKQEILFDNVGTVPNSSIRATLAITRGVSQPYYCVFITIPTDSNTTEIGIKFNDLTSYINIVRACITTSLGDIVDDPTATITCDSLVYYRPCTNSGDSVTYWFAITPEMRGKYLIVSTHINLNLKLYYKQSYNIVTKLSEDVAVLTEEVDELMNGTPVENVVPTNYTGLEIATFNKILCIGDSLTAGVANHNDIQGETFPTWDNYKFSYPTYLTKISGTETVNMGIGGANSTEWWTEHESSDLSGFTAAIIQLGVNDDTNTFMTTSRPSLINIVNKLRQENQGIYIFFSGIINALSYKAANEGEAYYQKDQYLRQIFNDLHDGYTEGGVEYEGYNRIYFIDHVAYGHLRTLNPWQNKIDGKYDNFNEGHLSAYGYWRLAKDYAAYISWYMATDQNNIFRNVRYVGTPFSYK